MLESKAKTCRSSRLQMFFKIGALKCFANFTAKQLYWSFFFNKVTSLGLQLYLKETPSQVFSGADTKVTD